MDELTRAIVEALGCDVTMDDEGDYYCSEHGDYLHHTGQCLEPLRIAAAIAPLVEAQVRDARAEAWDETAEEAYGWGWLHDWALTDVKERNPYRDEESNA